jgi:hypothetical protein
MLNTTDPPFPDPTPIAISSPEHIPERTLEESNHQSHVTHLNPRINQISAEVEVEV